MGFIKGEEGDVDATIRSIINLRKGVLFEQKEFYRFIIKYFFYLSVSRLDVAFTDFGLSGGGRLLRCDC